jgi:hypothetical protein
MMLRLLNLLMRRRSPRRELFVHEDDWGQIEVLPASCAEWCAREMGRLDAFAAAHEVPDGGGWTDMYVRDKPPAQIADLAIPFAAAVDALRARLPEFDVVTSGTFSDPQPVPHVRAFGPAHNVGVVLVPDRTRCRVEMISLILDREDAASAEVVGALASLPATEPLLLADWLGGSTVLIATEQSARHGGELLP